MYIRKKKGMAELIGIALEDAKSLKEFAALPDRFLKLVYINVDPNDKSTIERMVSLKSLPQFIPLVMSLTKKIAKSYDAVLVSHCDQVAQYVMNIWRYLKLLQPATTIIPPMGDEQFSFAALAKSMNPYGFKVLVRYWASLLHTLMEQINTAFCIAVTHMTRLALAHFEVQSYETSTNMANTVAMYIAYIENNVTMGSVEMREAYERFATAFIELLGAVTVFDTSESRIAIIDQSLQLELSFFDHREWLGSALRIMPGNSIPIWYQQMGCIGPWMMKINAEPIQRFVEATGGEPPESYRPKAFSSRAFASESEPIREALDGYTVVVERIRAGLLNGTRRISDVGILIDVLTPLNLGMELDDKQLDAIDDVMKRWTGYDMLSLIYMIDSTGAYLNTATNEHLARYAAAADVFIEGRTEQEIENDIEKKRERLLQQQIAIDEFEQQNFIDPNDPAYIALRERIRLNVAGAPAPARYGNLDDRKFETLLELLQQERQTHIEVSDLLKDRKPLDERTRKFNTLRHELTQAELVVRARIEALKKAFDDLGVEMTDNLLISFMEWYIDTGEQIATLDRAGFLRAVKMRLGKDITSADNLVYSLNDYVKAVVKLKQVAGKARSHERTSTQANFILTFLIICITGWFMYYMADKMWGPFMIDTPKPNPVPNPLDWTDDPQWHDIGIAAVDRVVRWGKFKMMDAGHWWLFDWHDIRTRFSPTGALGDLLSGSDNIAMTCMYYWVAYMTTRTFGEIWYTTCNASSRVIVATLYEDVPSETYRAELNRIRAVMSTSFPRLVASVGQLAAAIKDRRDYMMQGVLHFMDTWANGPSSIIGHVYSLGNRVTGRQQGNWFDNNNNANNNDNMMLEQAQQQMQRLTIADTPVSALSTYIRQPIQQQRAHARHARSLPSTQQPPRIEEPDDDNNYYKPPKL